MDLKKDSTTCYLCETQCKYTDFDRLEVKDRKRNTMLRNHKKAQIAVLMSDKVNFGMKKLIRDKEGHI